MSTESIKNICLTVLLIAIFVMDLLAHQWQMPEKELHGWDVTAGWAALIYIFVVVF